MRILVTGGQGMLGQAVCKVFLAEHGVIAPGRDKLDITNPTHIKQWLETTRPDWVFHLAALTNVDQCQREPDLAYQTNTTATAHLVEHCRQRDIGLLFVSSIAVFGGQNSQPYHEGDQPAPVNVYGDSKWQAEQLVATLPRHLIVRSGWLFGGGTTDKKFVRKIVELATTRDSIAVVNDKVGSPTYVVDLAEGMARLFRAESHGLFHLLNAGASVSRFALAKAIVALAGLPTLVMPVSSDHFPQLAPRPDMEAAISQYTQNWLPDWRTSLETYLEKLEIRD